MGIYYECSICGATEKGFRPSCECVEKETKYYTAMMIGSTILDSIVTKKECCIYLIQQLRLVSGDTVYISICIDCPADEYDPRIMEITKTQYDSIKRSVEEKLCISEYLHDDESCVDSEFYEDYVKERFCAGCNSTIYNADLCVNCEPNREQIKAKLDQELDDYNLSK